MIAASADLWELATAACTAPAGENIFCIEHCRYAYILHVKLTILTLRVSGIFKIFDSCKKLNISG